MTTSEGQISGRELRQLPPLIVGISGLSRDALAEQIRSGGRFVFFEYCISFIFLTLRHTSPIYFIPPAQHAWVRGLPFTLVSTCLGWWGLPWGIVYTPLTITANLLGGRDITAEIQSRFLVAEATNKLEASEAIMPSPGNAN